MALKKHFFWKWVGKMPHNSIISVDIGLKNATHVQDINKYIVNSSHLYFHSVLHKKITQKLQKTKKPFPRHNLLNKKFLLLPLDYTLFDIIDKLIIRSLKDWHIVNALI